MGTGVGFSAGGHVAVPHHVDDRVGRLERPGEPRQGFVLKSFERQLIGSLELYADREVVAAATPAPARGPSVPRALIARHELEQGAAPPDEKVRRHPEAGYASVIGVLRGIEPVQKELLNTGASELPGRKADCMNHQELDRNACRPLIAIG